MTTSESSAESIEVAAVIVLAAGGGTRMKSSKSKLLHELAGKSILSYSLSAASALNPDHLMVVVGHQREQVLNHIKEISVSVETAAQEQQRGTGHAVQCGLDEIENLNGIVVVTYGDVPMLTGDTLRSLVIDHRESQNDITVLSARVSDATGYGRLVRNQNRIIKIVEEKDATDQERKIDEINSGIYVFNADVLRYGLQNLNDDNAQGELYLTDVIRICNENKGKVGALQTSDIWQTEGINDRIQLARMNKEMNRRILDHWMAEGVTIIDPNSTWIDVDVDLSNDVTIYPGVILQGATSISVGAVIGPDTTLEDVEVGKNASVIRSHCSFAVIGENAKVGPFSFLRPGTDIGQGAKVGAFVETKNAVIGQGAKVPHLTYCGDADIGSGTNIGAGTIFANYDGETKNPTRVGKEAFVGSNSVLVAPVDIGDGAFVAAGSAVTKDVPPGDLAVARGHQHNSTGWISKRRPGSKSHKAAESSKQQVDPETSNINEQKEN